MDSPVVRDVFTLFAVLFAVAGMLVVRRFVSPEHLRENNDFTGVTYAFLGVVYGVYLAFMIVVVWERFDQADANTTSEAAHLLAVYHDVEALPDGPVLQTAILRYTDSVIHQDWPDIAAGRGENRTTTAKYNDMWTAVSRARIDNGDARQAAFFNAAVKELNDVSHYRRLRIISGEAALPRPMWAMLIAGGIGMVIFTYLLAAKHTAVQLLATVFLTALLTYSILLVAALQHPFSGDVSVSPEAFENVMLSMHGNG